MENKDNYKLVSEKRVGNAIIKVYRPILSEQEAAERRKIAEKGLERFYKSVVSRGVDWNAAVKVHDEAT